MSIAPDHSAIGSPTGQGDTSHEFLYHGSCRRCNHLDQARIIRLSTNNEVYTHYTCEKCGLPIFGFGRTSPRESLVSLLTTFSWNAQENGYQDPGLLACTNDPEQSGPPERPVDTLIDPSTLTQHEPVRGISLASSSRTRLSEAQPAPEGSQAGLFSIPSPSFLTHAALQAPSSTSNLEDDDDEQHSFVPDRTQAAPTSPVRKMLNHIRHVRHRIPWSGLGSRKRRHSGTSEPTILRLVRHVGTMTEDVLLPGRPAGFVADSPNAEAVAPPTTIDEPQPSIIGTAEHTQPDEATEELPDQHTSKRERMNAKRRQTTLQRKALRQRRCLCGDGCHCMGSKRTTAPGSVASRGTSMVPSHHLGRLLGGGSEGSSSSLPELPRQISLDRHVAFTGAGLDNSHPIGQGPPVERLLAEEFHFSRQSTSTSTTHDSQATTAINSSSSGDRSSRQQSTRTNSIPLEPFIEVLNRYLEQSRPEVLAALRNFHTVYPPQHAAAFSEINAVQDGQSRTVSPSRAPDVRPSTPQRASTISLSRLPEPSDVQDSPVSEDDSNRNSGAPTIIRAGGSSQMTPTPQSPEQGPPAPPEPQVNPDELANEIEQLASRSTET
ncbi:hypothetical protein MMC18_006514 [Xylographa bjoerkii]|nr:hypothetical protein [Xylographa bjoerkii]